MLWSSMKGSRARPRRHLKRATAEFEGGRSPRWAGDDARLAPQHGVIHATQDGNIMLDERGRVTVKTGIAKEIQGARKRLRACSDALLHVPRAYLGTESRGRRPILAGRARGSGYGGSVPFDAATATNS